MKYADINIKGKTGKAITQTVGRQAPAFLV
jgi:hypothetical protein